MKDIGSTFVSATSGGQDSEEILEKPETDIMFIQHEANKTSVKNQRCNRSPAMKGIGSIFVLATS